MSTKGKAMHYKPRHGGVEQESGIRRAARFAARDAAYRAALGLPAEHPLPKSLGSRTHGAMRTAPNGYVPE